MLHERNWQEAFYILFSNVVVIEMFNEFIACIKHTMMLAVLLEKMECDDQAMLVLEYIRDLAEDTNNNPEVIIAYEEIGKLY